MVNIVNTHKLHSSESKHILMEYHNKHKFVEFKKINYTILKLAKKYCIFHVLFNQLWYKFYWMLLVNFWKNMWWEIFVKCLSGLISGKLILHIVLNKKFYKYTNHYNLLFLLNMKKLRGTSLIDWEVFCDWFLLDYWLGNFQSKKAL